MNRKSFLVALLVCVCPQCHHGLDRTCRKLVVCFAVEVSELRPHSANVGDGVGQSDDWSLES